MKIKRLETFMANAGLRNYLFVRLTTDTGVTGIGEASLEWQERAVEVILNEWVASRGQIVGEAKLTVLPGALPKPGADRVQHGSFVPVTGPKKA